MTSIELWPSAIAVLVLLTIAVTALSLARVELRLDAAVAVLRATVQLLVVALVIAWVFRHPEGVWAYLAVMIAVATLTATRRIGAPAALAPRVAAGILVGAAAAVVPVLALGALASKPETILPFTAQIIGGAMTAVALTGTRLRDEAARDWDQVEAWLAIGSSPRQAVAPFGRLAVGRALIPALDQTRSAGLVTLPGAFVGLLLGGASPTEAAEVQLLVLAGLVAAESVAAVLTARLLSAWVGTHRCEPGP